MKTPHIAAPRILGPVLCAVGVTLTLALASCGGAAGSYTDDRQLEPERDDPEQLAQEVRDRELTLSQALSRTAPDCERACELREMICELRERICGIAERHPSDEATQTRCQDAGVICERSGDRVEEQCACSGGDT